MFVTIAPIKAIGGAVKLTQSDGDLAAHIAVGERILASRGIPATSLASYTAPSDPFVAHAWLSEVIFALLFRIGRLPLIAVITGITIGLTHAIVVVFLKRRGVDPRWALIAGLVSLTLGVSHWLTRPHMFSILAAALTIFLLEANGRRRLVWLGLLFAVWANLHGGWLYGLVLIAVHAGAELLEAKIRDDNRVRAHALETLAGLGVAAIATLLNPYGPALHTEVARAVTSPVLAQHISEYQSPNFQRLADLPFLLVLLLTVAVLSASTAVMPLHWVAISLIALFFALRAARNIALFGVTAWPLLALHFSRARGLGRGDFPAFRDFARIDARARAGAWSIVVAALLLALGLNHGRLRGAPIIRDEFDGSVFPVEAVAKAREAGLGRRIYHPWIWGGYLMYAWPGAPIHVDPLKFSETTLVSYERIDTMRPGWQAELRKWSVDLVILRQDAPLALAMASEPGWQQWYRDSTAVVFIPRPGSTEGQIRPPPRPDF